MTNLSLRSVVGGVASVVMAVSLVACADGGSLVANIRKDGSLEFVATGQASETETQGGITVDEGQSIAIDLSGLKEGSMHVEILGETEDLGEDTDADDILATLDPDPNEVIFSQTLSAEDIDHYDDGTIVLDDLVRDYYIVNVSADHATGTIVVSACDADK